MLKRILAAIFCTAKEEKIKTVQAPDFIFPETVRVWVGVMKEIAKKREKEEAEYRLMVEGYCDRQKEIQKINAQPRSAVLEIRRRQLDKDNAKMLCGYRADEWSRQNERKQEIQRAEEELHAMERARVAKEGKTLLQEFKDHDHPIYQGQPRRVFRRERRLVQLKDGRYFICSLIHEGVMKKMGTVEGLIWFLGQYDAPRSRTVTIPVLEPTGAYEEPVAEWVNSSYQQFNQKELELIAQREAVAH